MTAPTPLPPPPAPVERKVVAATVGALAAAGAIAILNAIQSSPGILGSLPIWAQTLFIIGVPPLITFLAGYRAAHTPR